MQNNAPNACTSENKNRVERYSKVCILKLAGTQLISQ
ncbi:hypothetical protein [Escherichia phage 11W]|nr:hypothetical protein PQA54_gp44 [Escherichia phage 11W]ULG00906.1 hypothetical protein [Escherichia phage 11W]